MKFLWLAMPILILAALPTFAGQVKSNDPASVIAALQNAGYKAKLDKDNEGNPEIDTANDGNDIYIYLLGCTNHKDCTYSEIVVSWHCSSDIIEKCKEINLQWNSKEQYAQTVMIKDMISMYYFLDLDVGGMSEDLFIDNFKAVSSAATELEKLFPVK